MKLISRGESCYCVASEEYSIEKLEQELHKRAGVRKDSFAEQYTRKIFMDLFRYAKNLREEYLEFYREEYKNFEEYLYQKELWEKWEIRELQLDETKTVLQLRYNLNNYNAGSIVGYGVEKEGLDMLNRILAEVHL